VISVWRFQRSLSGIVWKLGCFTVIFRYVTLVSQVVAHNPKRTVNCHRSSLHG
jgi:hypothetical protein